MSSTPQLFPVGRLVWGSLSEPQTKDANGQPLIIKNGPDAGKPTQRYAFGVAIPKTPNDGGHWANTEWGKQIWALAHAAWPQGQAQWPKFAWKIKDGDSNERNERGRMIREAEGYPGHWVVSFSSSFAPKVHDAKGTRELSADEIRAIKTGYFVQVYGTVTSNENAQKPGLYINHSMVAFAGYGPEIRRGPDPTAVGFGSGPAPAGMSTTPPANLQPPPAAAPAGIPPPVGTPPAPAVAAPIAPPVAAPAAPPAPTAVAPHAGFRAPDAVAAPPVAPPPAAPPPAAPAVVWKGPASGYDAHKAAGWSDEQMRQAGYL